MCLFSSKLFSCALHFNQILDDLGAFLWIKDSEYIFILSSLSEIPSMPHTLSAGAFLSHKYGKKWQQQLITFAVTLFVATPETQKTKETKENRQKG